LHFKYLNLLNTVLNTAIKYLNTHSYLNVKDRQTDGQTDDLLWHHRAMRSNIAVKTRRENSDNYLRQYSVLMQRFSCLSYL